jgi:hypothetical protein
MTGSKPVALPLGYTPVREASCRVLFETTVLIIRTPAFLSTKFSNFFSFQLTCGCARQKSADLSVLKRTERRHLQKPDFLGSRSAAPAAQPSMAAEPRRRRSQRLRTSQIRGQNAFFQA